MDTLESSETRTVTFRYTCGHTEPRVEDNADAIQWLGDHRVTVESGSIFVNELMGCEECEYARLTHKVVFECTQCDWQHWSQMITAENYETLTSDRNAVEFRRDEDERGRIVPVVVLKMGRCECCDGTLDED